MSLNTKQKDSNNLYQNKEVEKVNQEEAQQPQIPNTGVLNPSIEGYKDFVKETPPNNDELQNEILEAQFQKDGMLIGQDNPEAPQVPTQMDIEGFQTINNAPAKPKNNRRRK